MNNKILIGIVVVILVIIGIVYWTKNTSVVKAPATVNSTLNQAVGPQIPAPATVKEFNVSADNFKFSLNQIKVNKGDTVRINFVNAEGFHDWKIDEFAAATKVLKIGEKETIQFVANQGGQFEYYCSVGNHRAMGMKGTLFVAE